MFDTLLLSVLASAGAAGAQDRIEFERDVRPILEESCFRCHGPHARRIRGDLMMAGREDFLEGGYSGPAIVPGDPDASLLIRMVRYENEDLEMPPTGPLDPDDVAVLEQWVREGAVWPEGEDSAFDTREISLEEGRQWWAFRPVERPEVPELAEARHRAEARGDLDRFVFAKLEEHGLEAAPTEEERQLVRRLYVDLLGIQPTRAEVEAYLSDERPDRWERLIDELLDRPEYGERQGRRWLDVVRFAQTHGYERDQEKPFAWRYRDWVIDAFNADMPYDRFLIEQLAGDELDEVTEGSLVATGFYALGVWDTEPTDPEQAILDAKDDVLRTITEGMLGVTVGCARCHDHRFDPVRQRDYYSLAALLSNVQPYDKPVFNPESGSHRLPRVTPQIRAAWDHQRKVEKRDKERELREGRRKRLQTYLEQNFARLVAEDPELEGYTGEGQTLREIARKLGVTDAEVGASLPIQRRIESILLEEQAKRLEISYQGDLPWILAVAETGTEPEPTHVLRRGQASSKLAPVSAGFLPVLCPDDASANPTVEPREAQDGSGRTSTGQRRALAEWIASPDHPTTARVIVNRLWQGHFGHGLVRTPDDFGTQGERPSHPRLLDWLADELVTNGWSLKRVHRLILCSATYRRTSSFTTPDAELVDPDNRLLWRQNRLRLDAESLRDSILAVSGLLNPERGGRGFFPELSLEALASSSKPGSGWSLSDESQRNRRAVYAYAKRGMPVPFLTAFDAPDSSFGRGTRASTTVASQALTLLNGAFTNRVAVQLARELLAEHDTDLAAVVRAVYGRVLLRDPTPRERELATAFLERQTASFEALPPRSTFRPAVPKRVGLVHLNELEGGDCLFAPREAWDSHVGLWGNGYNMTVEALPGRGPFALLREPRFKDGTVAFDLELDPDCERVDFLLRAREQGSVATGLGVAFDVEAGELVVSRVTRGLDEPNELARVPCALSAETRHRVELQLTGARLVVRVDGAPVLEHTANRPGRRMPAGAGRFGISPAGAGVHLEHLTVRTNGRETEVRPDDPGPPLERAVALLVLTALNLNEFLYVD